ncbi:hypothetical protein PVA45_04195 [Entomospira entomophila]|uniref:FAD synthase n=1 Tax=Entomospira entomophila TaxID=2719988 RepID=A0A968KWD5_9SPIO|nr:hypothetical protein [Entomospira entomophilus]NIZ40710.1 hypothetical protein [Entomospira entomophilus]WDI34923.1 hypothetical protein PVA45_04195 [Entomospira entomophilus]
MVLPICGTPSMIKRRNWNDPEFYATPISIALGSFDAIHYGHQELLKYRSTDLEPWVLYFRRAPQTLYQTNFIGMVRSERQRVEIFQELGLKGAFTLDFLHEISTMSGVEFMEALRSRLCIKSIVVGEDFRFGKEADANSYELREWAKKYAIHVKIIPLLPNRENSEKFSSSSLRQAIQRGSFSLIQESSGFPYAIDLRDVKRWYGNGSWHYLVTDNGQVLPSPGLYETYDGDVIKIENGLVSSSSLLEQALLRDTL